MMLLLLLPLLLLLHQQLHLLLLLLLLQTEELVFLMRSMPSNPLDHSASKVIIAHFLLQILNVTTHPHPLSQPLFFVLPTQLFFYSAASFAAGNVFFEIVFSSISFDSAPVIVYFTLSSLTFALGTMTIIISIIIPVAVQNAHAARGAKSALMLKLKPLVQLSHLCCIWHTLSWTASLLVWGPIKFPPFSWMTYTLPALGLLLMVQQLLDIRRICFRCDSDCSAAADLPSLL
jgi:hypothetical protein